jgi:hypothetical protein
MNELFEPGEAGFEGKDVVLPGAECPAGDSDETGK